MPKTVGEPFREIHRENAYFHALFLQLRRFCTRKVADRKTLK